MAAFVRKPTPGKICFGLLMLPPIVKITPLIGSVGICVLTPPIILAVDSYMAILSYFGRVTENTRYGVSSSIFASASLLAMYMAEMTFSVFRKID